MDNVNLILYAAKGMGIENENFQAGYKAGQEYLNAFDEKDIDFKLGAVTAILEFLNEVQA